MTLNLRPLECFHSRDQYLCKIRLLKQQQPKKHLRAELSQHLFGTPIWPPHVMWNLSPPQRLPLGIPIKIAIIRKNRKRAGSDGKREKAHSVFLSRQPSRNTKMPLRRREMWNHGIRLSICLFVFIAPRTRKALVPLFHPFAWVRRLIEWYHDYHNFVRMGSFFSPNGGRHIQ